MAEFVIDDLDDPRVAPFRDLPAQASGPRLPDRFFLAEGERLLMRLLRAGLPLESVLIEPGRLTRLRPLLDPRVTILQCPRDLLRRIVGFRFHRGVLARAARPPNPSCEQLVSGLPPRATLVACDGVQDPENLGGMIRTAAAFGAAAVICGKPVPDPFSRRVLRVSIGSVFRLPVRVSDNLPDDLGWCCREAGFEMAAAVLEQGATPLAEAHRPARLLLLLGSEERGLSDELLAACDTRLTIPLPGGIDSLNVSVAAGIFLYQLRDIGAAVEKNSGRAAYDSPPYDSPPFGSPPFDSPM